ncbi:hypothetical protein BKA61DRAFT_57390 [Leptodontidium sp. MPI-SDFR-AT-0119]|nr:hypothetical protein BKA61DRAFT_57390 [Leptodontidium sp. MPI-SDFR-AT-0119]
MTVAHTMPSFEALAPELIVPILAGLQDLEALDYILRASPAAYRVFNTQSAGILITVLSSGFTHTYTCALIRIIALIRSSTLPSTAHDLATFKSLVLHETTPHRYEPRSWIHSQTTFPNILTPRVAHSLLATNRKIQHLTTSCLKFYLDHFRALRPSHSADYTFEKPGYMEYPENLKWKDKRANEAYHYPVHDIGPPSWLEQQRVQRAFWRIQLSQDLTSAIRETRITWSDAREASELEKLSPADLCDVPFDMDLLECRELSLVPTLLEHELLRLAVECPTTLGKPEHPNQVEQEATYWRIQKDWAIENASAAASGTRTNEPSEAAWKILDLTFRSKMWDTFGGLAGDQWIHEEHSMSPLQHAKFDPWRPYGFPIWSTERMVGYGLLLQSDGHGAIMEVPYFEAWGSLLSKEERDEIDRENEEQEAFSMLPQRPPMITGASGSVIG